MENDKEKDWHKNKRAEKEYSNNVTEDVIYDELFIAKISNQEHEHELFIAGSGATSNMVNLEEKMTNLKYAETRVTVGDIRNLTWKNVVIETAIRDVTENYIAWLYQICP